MERGRRRFYVLMLVRSILVDLRKRVSRGATEQVERRNRFSYVLIPNRSILVDLRKKESRKATE